MSIAIDILKTELAKAQQTLKEQKAAYADDIRRGDRAHRAVADAQAVVTQLQTSLHTLEEARAGKPVEAS